jgi:hypothetical protein
MRHLGIGLRGVAVLLAAAGGARAEEVTIGDDLTEPVRTSTIDSGAPGDLVIGEDGSITVDSGAAVTVDSDNSARNEGSIATEDANDTTGISIEGGHSGVVNNSGVISLTEDHALEDADDDGDYDGDYAIGSNRFGMILSGAAAFSGDIVNEGSITVEGEDSAGVRIEASLDGDLSSTGSISVVGDRSVGIDINANISGDVRTGSVSATGEGVVGIDVAASIGGGLFVSGATTANGFHSTYHPTDEDAIAALDPDDLLIAGPALGVHADVAGGVTIVGVGVEDDDDDDGDGVLEDVDGDGVVDEEDDEDDDLTGSVAVYGPSPALWVAPDAASGADIALGAARDGFGLVNRGSVSAYGVYDGFAATGVLVEGVAGAEVSTAGGVLNDGSISVTTFEANSTAIAIGAGASAPTIRNRGTIASTSDSDGADSAFGVRIDAGAAVSTFENSGEIVATLYGETGDAVAFSDASGGVATILNTGSILTYNIATDEDEEDGVTPVAAGSTIAFDLTASTSGVLLRQSSDISFTDDDSTDDDEDARPSVQILGDIRFGSGADALEALAGVVAGDISFGIGADTLLIDGQAEVYGVVSDSDGLLAIDVRDGVLGLLGGALDFTEAHFGANAILGVTLSTDASASTMLNGGIVAFDSGASILPVIPDGLPEDGAIVFLHAGSLVGAENVTGTIVREGVPWLYNVEVRTTANDSNALEAAYAVKSPEDLGLDRNETAAFAQVLAALRRDDDAAEGFSTLDSAEEFFDAYDDLLPNFASGAAELAGTAIDQGQRAASTRLARARAGRIDYDSAWLQEIAFGVTRTPETDGVAYGGWGFGFAAGFDAPLENGMLLGLSAAFTGIEVEQDQSDHNVIASNFGQLSAYLGASYGPLDLDFVGGFGLGRMSSRRDVDFAGAFSASAEAAWWAYEAHASTRAAMPVQIAPWLSVTPNLGLSYVTLAEPGYEEEGGGAAIDLVIDGTTSQRLWGDAGIVIASAIDDGAIDFAPQLSLGWRTNLIDEVAQRTVRFASGGESFVLTDEALGEGGPVIGFALNAGNAFTTFSFSYEGEFSESLERQSINAALRFKF